MTTHNYSVLLVGNYAPDNQLSMLRFTATLAENLQRLGVKVVVTRPPTVFGRIARDNPRLKKLAGYFDKFVLFPLILLKSARAHRVVHIADQSNALYLPVIGAHKAVLTCHDLFAVRMALGEYSQNRGTMRGGILQRLNLRGLRRLRHVTTVSAATSDDFFRIAGKNARLTLIPNALDARFQGARPPLTRQSPPAPPYFLHLGNNNFYKNRPGVVRLFGELARLEVFSEHRLVLAGKMPEGDLQDEIDRSPARDRIDVRVDLTDEDVHSLYAGAEALLFISLAEGFGWPIIEAQASGCLVVTSDREPMRSVAGGGAVLVDPENPAQAAAAIAAAHKDFARIRDQGSANAEAYSSDMIFPRYLDVYREVVSG